MGKLHPLRGAASILCVGRNSLMAWMREEGILTHENIPTWKEGTKNWFSVEETIQNDWKRLVTRVTDTGLNALESLVEQAVEDGKITVATPKKVSFGNPKEDMSKVINLI